MAKIQLVLLLTIVSFAIISSVQSVPVKDSSVEKNNAEKCQKLCGFCGCTGYYCGDECLCECNSQTDGEAECVDTMKSNCKKLELPFEVLIQGPNVNRMVRSLLYADPQQEQEQVCAKSELQQMKRSTISIYKPDVSDQQDEILSTPEAHKSDASSRVTKNNEPVQVVVAQKSSASEVTAVKVEPVSDDNVEDIPTVASNSNIKLSSSDEDFDRVNIKREVSDVNQEIAAEISDIDSLRDTESSLYKRDADDVAAPIPDIVAAAAQGILSEFKLPIVPTNEELVSAWEGVRDDFNTNIAKVIDAAKVVKIGPLLKLGKDEVGSALLLPLLPAVAAAKAVEFPFKVAALPIKAGITAGIKIPLKAEAIKHFSAIKLNDQLLRDAAKILNLEHKMLFPIGHAIADEVAEVGAIAGETVAAPLDPVPEA